MSTMMPRLKGRLPTKMFRRSLTVYVGFIFIVFVIFRLGTSGLSSTSSKTGDLLKRGITHNPNGKPGYEFPRKIWQTWKVDPLGFEERDLTCARTWTQKNPGHRYEVLTDNNDMYYVETHFGPGGLNRPDIVYMYRSLTLKIIKADLLRYLIMYVEGGLYADIDVEDLRPIDRFIPDRYQEKDVHMVIGVEIDQPDFEDHPILGKKSKSFCQWTFMCKPGLPVMMKLIDGIVKWLGECSKKQGVPVSEIVLDFDEVISGTGPSAFTEAVLTEMGKKEGRRVTWDEFHGLSESKLVGGVLVLTVEAFAAGQGHSDSGNHNARTALVKHRYHASQWPSQHHRYKHPVFGEVEKCNWDPQCVQVWDYSKNAFEQLAPEEQTRQIAEKEAADVLEAEKAEQARKEEAENALRLERIGIWEKEQAKLKAEAPLKKLAGDVAMSTEEAETAEKLKQLGEWEKEQERLKAGGEPKPMSPEEAETAAKLAKLGDLEKEQTLLKAQGVLQNGPALNTQPMDGQAAEQPIGLPNLANLQELPQAPV